MDSGSILMMVQNKLPNDAYSINTLKERLDKLDDKQREGVMSKIATLNLKSPTMVFWVGSFLLGQLGVNRFMIGDTGLGIAKLAVPVVCLLSFITAVIVAANNSEPVISVFLYLVSGVAMFVWWVVDLFLTGKKLRKKNYEKILRIL